MTNEPVGDPAPAAWGVNPYCAECGKSLGPLNIVGYCLKHRQRVYSHRHRERHAQVRAQVSAIKLAAGCADCGYNARACALDFDHKPGEVKLFSIGNNITAYPWDTILREIAKCEVVCAICHRIRTEDRQQLAARAARTPLARTLHDRLHGSRPPAWRCSAPATSGPSGTRPRSGVPAAACG